MRDEAEGRGILLPKGWQLNRHIISDLEWNRTGSHCIVRGGDECGIGVHGMNQRRAWLMSSTTLTARITIHFPVHMVRLQTRLILYNVERKGNSRAKFS